MVDPSVVMYYEYVDPESGQKFLIQNLATNGVPVTNQV